MESDRIKIIGIGGAACQAVNLIAGSSGHGPECLAVDTDRAALKKLKHVTRVEIGEAEIVGAGTGGVAGMGRKAAQRDLSAIRAVMTDSSLVVVVVGLGGGTGTGCVPVLLNEAHKVGALTLTFATLPFGFEGPQRRQAAGQALSQITGLTDALVVIPNQRLAGDCGDMTVADSFAKADTVLCDGVNAMWKMLERPGYIKLGIADLKQAVAGCGALTMGYGTGEGEQRAQAAVADVLNGPLTQGGRLVSEAELLIVSIMAGPDLKLQEVDEVMSALSESASQGAQIAMGTVVDDEWAGRMTITVLLNDLELEVGAAQPPVVLPELEEAPESKPVKSGSRSKRGPRQTSLSFVPAGRGRFKDVEPTLLDGEDLDIPTFIRRGIEIER